MKTKILFFALFILNYANAQNWMPISKNHVYNYKLSNDSIISSSLWVDSVATSSPDTIWFLNKVYKQNGSYLYINQPSFLLSRFTKHDTLLKFQDSLTNKSFKLIINDTSSFVFDSTNNIFAHCISKKDSNLWGMVIDSINTFLLSDSNTVIISKNHGILKFPSFQSHLHYLLAGIQNSIGTQVPMFNDFFNFNIGDIFEYNSTESAWDYPDYNIYSIKRITISNKIVNGDSLLYICTLRQKVVDIDYINSTDDTTYSASTDTILYINFPNSFINKYSCNIDTIYNNYVNPVNLYYNTTYQCISKYFGGYSGNAYYNDINDTLSYSPFDDLLPIPFPVYLEDIEPFLSWWHPYADHETLSYLYSEGLGLTEKNYSAYNMSTHYNYSYSLNLTAAKTQNRNFGTFTNDSLWPSQIQVLNNNAILIAIYPNPATNNLTIQAPPPATIELTNIQGQLIEQQTTNVETTNIVVSALAKGMYFVKVKTEKGVAVKKFIKE